MVQCPNDSVTAGSLHAPKLPYDLSGPWRFLAAPTTIAAVVAVSVVIGVILFFTLTARP
jgi:hypothetical protein